MLNMIEMHTLNVENKLLYEFMNELRKYRKIGKKNSNLVEKPLNEQ